MKKLSFFLMAMLFSVMSFAAETLLFTQTYPGNPSKYTNAYTSSFTVTTGDYVLTYANINNGQQSNNWTAVRAGSKSTASVATITSEQIAKPISKVTINFTQVNGTSTNELYLEVSASSDFATVTKVNADIAVGTVEFTLTTPAANQYYRIVIDQAKASANGFNRFDAVSFYEGEAASEEPVEIVNAPIFSTSTANFTEAFTLNITSDEGTTLKYTLDNTDPTTSETAIEVATNTASVEITKSTAVKAIAIKGELISATKSKVYCYVNTPETAYTVAEAIAVIDAGLGLDNELYVKGEISEVESFNETYGSITYWIQDEEGNKFECYSGLGLNKAKFTSIDDLVVGSKVVVCGVMKLYTTSSGDKIYEFNYNNYIVSLELPVTTYDVTVADATVSTVGQNIVLSGSWEEKALTIMLWQGGATQGFGTYAAEDYGPITLGTTELTATSEGVYADNGDGTFAFTATATDADGAIYNISVTGAIPATVEPETVEIEATAEFADNGEGSLYIDVCEENWAWCVQLTVWDCDGSAGEYEISGLYSTDNDYNVSGTATIAYDEYAETDVLTATLKTADESLTVLVTLYKKAAKEEPKTITWELNGGEVVATVPTNEELWEMFKPYYNEYYIANGKLDSERSDQPMADAAIFAATYMMDIMTDEASEYKWLGDYVAKVTTDAGRTINTEVLWRFGVAAFFNCKAEAASTWNGNADFTEAGKPEAWGAAYQAAHAIVLPTEPVTEDYVLPTPVKSGYTFVGWYDNAEGTGEALTVLKAGWSGTLYAIWKQDTTTTLENITVEGKAVKAIINGQLIIIKNGVQYNALGQVIK